jgi:hypothetical protein
MQPRLTIHARPAGIVTTISSAVPARGNDRRHRAQPLPGRLSGARFWKNALARGAVDESLERHRPPAGAGQRTRRDRQVELHEVELRCPDRLEEDLARVRDHDLAIPEPEDLLLLRHGPDASVLSIPTTPNR